ncbi:molybdenum cofactor synthesis domain-containing protein [Myceligenerans crystallogenes]|uniref:molybdopterin molybdotransferase MoeA n=1 Tax=Myceligenerans crystallogenes TaxID=316335 RepID=UPI0031D76603
MSVEEHRDDVARLLAGISGEVSGTTTVGAEVSGTTTVGAESSGATAGGAEVSGTATVGAEGSGTTTVGAQLVPVGDALGRVLAGDVLAPEPLPRFRNSQMDGFAVRAADIAGATVGAPVILPVAGEIAAGSAAAPLAPGTAVRIMTGAPVPAEADAVVPVEDTDVGTFNHDHAAARGSASGRETNPPADPASRLEAPHDPDAGERKAGGSGTAPVGSGSARIGSGSVPVGSGSAWVGFGSVRIIRSRAAGEFVREVGSDVGAGDLVLSAGTVLAPHHLAAVAACGVAELPVRRRLRVAVVSTGTELVAPGEPAGPGQIWDANAVALAAAVRAAGAEVAGTYRITDDPEAARRALRTAAASSDLVITSGGVSQGAHEVVKDVLSGAVFRSVAMQPGGPQGFGRLDGTPVVTFPGNPVSAQVSFVVFLRDPLRRAAGLPTVGELRAVVGHAGESGGSIASPLGRRQYLRGRLRPAGGMRGTVGPKSGSRFPEGPTARTSDRPLLQVDVVGGAGSHLVASMGAADVLVEVPADRSALDPGDEVTLLPLG